VPFYGGRFFGGRFFGSPVPVQLGASLWWTLKQLNYQDSTLTTPATSQGDPLGGFVDYSGNGNTGGASGNLRPLLNLTGLNNRPCAEYDMTDDVTATIAAFTYAQPVTIATVSKLRTMVGSAQSIHDSNTSGQLMRFRTDNANRYVYASNTAVTITSPVVTLNPIIEIAVYNSPASSLEINGTSASTGATTGVQSLGGYRTGASQTPNQYASLSLGEAIVIRRALTAGEITALRAYLTVEWGL